jgi:integrase
MAMLKKHYKAAGIKIEGISTHTLRHTFCTQHAAKGTNIIVIQHAFCEKAAVPLAPYPIRIYNVRAARACA